MVAITIMISISTMFAWELVVTMSILICTKGECVDERSFKSVFILICLWYSIFLAVD